MQLYEVYFNNTITDTNIKYDLFLKLKTRLAVQYFGELKAGVTGWPKSQTEIS